MPHQTSRRLDAVFIESGGPCGDSQRHRRWRPASGGASAVTGVGAQAGASDVSRVTRNEAKGEGREASNPNGLRARGSMWRRHSCLRVAEGDREIARNSKCVMEPGGSPMPAIRFAPRASRHPDAALRAARRQECLRHIPAARSPRPASHSDVFVPECRVLLDELGHEADALLVL